MGGEDAPRRPICGVSAAGHVTEMEGCTVTLGFKEFVDSTKDKVGSPIATPPVLPTIDDTLVVTEYAEMRGGIMFPAIEDRMDKELEPDTLGPSDIALTVEILPVWAECPRTPIPIDNNCNSNGGARV